MVESLEATDILLQLDGTERVVLLLPECDKIQPAGTLGYDFSRQDSLVKGLVAIELDSGNRGLVVDRDKPMLSMGDSDPASFSAKNALLA